MLDLLSQKNVVLNCIKSSADTEELTTVQWHQDVIANL